MRRRNRGPKFTKAIPVALDPELYEQVAAVANEWGEGISTVMREAMRFGLPLVIEDLRRKKGKITYQLAQQEQMLIEDQPKKKTK